MREVFGELVIVFGEIRRVLFRRGRTRAHVQHQIKFPQRAALQTRQQIGGLDVIGKAQRREVAPFFVRAENVADDDVVAAAPVQRPDQRAANEARAAGDQHARVGKIVWFHRFTSRGHARKSAARQSWRPIR